MPTKSTASLLRVELIYVQLQDLTWPIRIGHSTRQQELDSLILIGQNPTYQEKFNLKGI